MACVSPITVDSPAGPIQVACKQCLNCRISKQSALSLRCIMESRTTLSGEFWTMTFADAPEKGDYSEASKFLKRYRIWNKRQGNLLPIRFLCCGEYGGKTGRFHFHALIFNGLPAPKGPSLTRLWPHGFVYIGQVTPASIRYTARYTLKFHAKGQEAVANWSKKPALGADGMIELARYMKNRGDKLSKPPSILRIENKTYCVDATMQDVFWNAFAGSTMPSSAAHSHLMYRLHRIIGDPVAEQAKRQNERNQFYETARLINETL